MRYHRRTAPRVVNGRVCRKNRWRQEPDYTRTQQVRIERCKPRPGYRHFLAPPDISAFLALLPDWRELAIGLQRVVLSDATSCYGWHRPGTVAVCAWSKGCVQVYDPQFYTEHAGVLQRLRVPCRRLVMVADPRYGSRGPYLSPVADPYCLGCSRSIDQGRRWYHLEGEDGGLCPDCGFDRKDVPAAALRPDPLANDPEAGTPAYLAEFTETTVQAFQLVHILLHELGHHHDRMTSPRQRDSTQGERYAEEYALKHEQRIWSAYCRVFKPG